MKKISTVLLLAGALCFNQACNSGNSDSVDQADSVNDARDTTGLLNNNDSTANPVNGNAADFAVEAASGGMMEVQLGKIAQQKATMASVKDFGAMMVKDHSKANEELKDVAQKENIALPQTLGADKQDKINDLQQKTGKDFDKAYVDMMVSDHKEDINKFQDAAKNNPDSLIRNCAAKTLPVLQKHLDAIQKINDNMNNNQ